MGNNSRFRLAATLLLGFILALSSVPLRAEGSLPAQLKDVGIDAPLGATIPLNLAFTDETGQAVTLDKYFNKNKPVILTLVYYECPMLCTVVLNNFSESLKSLPWTPGGEFEIVTVSFNPLETPALAKAKKESYMQAYGRPAGAAGWHFLTGREDQIKALAAAVGFRYAWDPVQKQYAHATGIFFLSPAGKLSRCLYGIDYPPRDLRLALTETAEGRVGSLTDKILLFCYHYDPVKKGYAMAAFRVMQAAGTLTVLVLVLLIGSLLLWERRRRRKESLTGAPQSAPCETRK